MFPFTRFVVTGHSMEPLFKEGDRIVINHLAYIFSKPKTGDIVAFEHSNEKKETLLKKVEKVTGDQLTVVGLNDADTLDSRQLGQIKKSQIIGKVLTKY